MKSYVLKQVQIPHFSKYQMTMYSKVIILTLVGCLTIFPKTISGRVLGIVDIDLSSPLDCSTNYSEFVQCCKKVIQVPQFNVVPGTSIDTFRFTVAEGCFSTSGNYSTAMQIRVNAPPPPDYPGQLEFYDERKSFGSVPALQGSCVDAFISGAQNSTIFDPGNTRSTAGPHISIGPNYLISFGPGPSAGNCFVGTGTIKVLIEVDPLSSVNPVQERVSHTPASIWQIIRDENIVPGAGIVANVIAECLGCEGRPIGTADGTLFFDVADFSYQRPGFPFEFKRYYNSKRTSTSRNLGQGWMTNYDSSIVFDQITNKATVFFPNQVFVFTRGTFNTDGTINYNPPAGAFSSLLEIPRETINPVRDPLAVFKHENPNLKIGTTKRIFRLTDKYGKEIYFAAFLPGPENLCKPVFERDLNGNSLNYQYENWISSETKSLETKTIHIDPNGFTPSGGDFTINTGLRTQVDDTRLKKITAAPFAWSLDFQYSPEKSINGNVTTYSGNLLTQVKNSLGDIINFTYSNGILTSVDRSENYGAIYQYSTNVPANFSPILTSVDDNLHEKADRHPRYEYQTDSAGKFTKQVKRVRNGRGDILYEFAIPSPIPTPNSTYEATIRTMLPNGTLEKKRVDTYRNDNVLGIQRISTTNYLTDSGALGLQTYSYNSNNQVTQFIDGNGHATLMDYDVLGNLIHRKDAEGFEEFFTYDEVSRLINSTDQNGNQRTYKYDDGINLSEISEPIGKVTRFSNFPGGLLKSITDANDHKKEFTYDSNGNTRTITSAEGRIDSYFYDARSRLISYQDSPEMTPMRFQWNSNNSLEKIIFGDSSTFRLEYLDQNGNPSLVEDQNGKQSRFIFDRDDNVITITKNNGQSDEITTFAYDARSNRISMIDAENHTTTYNFNNQDKLSTQVDPLGRITAFTYDGVVNVNSRTDANGVVATFSYYKNNRLKKLSFSDSTAEINYVYDGNGNRIEATDAEGQKKFIFDALNRNIQSQNISQNFVVDNSYDLVGNRLSMRNNKVNGEIKYSYTADDLLKSIVDTDGKTITYSYNATQQLKEIVFPGGVAKTTYTYDPQNHFLQSVKNINGRGELISHFDYGRDAAGRITQTSSLDGTSLYTYDSINRLTQVENPGRPAGTTKYFYDKSGNRTKLDENGNVIVGSYDSANELNSYGSIQFSYDANGNMTSKVDNGIGKSYQWDALNRLKEVKNTVTNATIAQFTYNGYGWRVRKDTPLNGTINYLMDNNRVCLETDGAGSIIRRYVPGFSVTDKFGNKLYELTDGRGNVSGHIDTRGNIVTDYVYASFGQEKGMSSDKNGFRFAGEHGVFSDDDIGLVYMKHRWYDSEIGRFISRDPIGFDGGFNEYTYVENDPINEIDSSGLVWKWLSIIYDYFFGDKKKAAEAGAAKAKRDAAAKAAAKLGGKITSEYDEAYYECMAKYYMKGAFSNPMTQDAARRDCEATAINKVIHE